MTMGIFVTRVGFIYLINNVKLLIYGTINNISLLLLLLLLLLLQ